ECCGLGALVSEYELMRVGAQAFEAIPRSDSVDRLVVMVEDHAFPPACARSYVLALPVREHRVSAVTLHADVVNAEMARLAGHGPVPEQLPLGIQDVRCVLPRVEGVEEDVSGRGIGVLAAHVDD